MKIQKYQNAGVLPRRTLFESISAEGPQVYTDGYGVEREIVEPSWIQPARTAYHKVGDFLNGKGHNLSNEEYLVKYDTGKPIASSGVLSWLGSPAEVEELALRTIANSKKVSPDAVTEAYIMLGEKGMPGKKYLDKIYTWGKERFKPVSEDGSKVVELLNRRDYLRSLPEESAMDSRELSRLKKQIEDIEAELSRYKGTNREWDLIEEMAHKNNMKRIAQRENSIALENEMYNDASVLSLDKTFEVASKSERAPLRDFSWGPWKNNREIRVDSTLRNQLKDIESNQNLWDLINTWKNSSDPIEKALSYEATATYKQAKYMGLSAKDATEAIRSRLMYLKNNPYKLYRDGGILKRK